MAARNNPPTQYELHGCVPHTYSARCIHGLCVLRIIFCWMRTQCSIHMQSMHWQLYLKSHPSVCLLFFVRDDFIIQVGGSWQSSMMCCSNVKCADGIVLFCFCGACFSHVAFVIRMFWRFKAWGVVLFCNFRTHTHTHCMPSCITRCHVFLLFHPSSRFLWWPDSCLIPNCIGMCFNVLDCVFT